jgi:hypothetical protein
MKTSFYYHRIDQMEPREGQKFATRYLKQSPQHRTQLVRHIRDCSNEIIDYLEDHPEEMAWHTSTPLKGFPKTGGQKNRTTWELVTDLCQEAAGTKRDGTPKDFAMAPIERWNKLFDGTDYEIFLEEHNPSKKFNQLFSKE